MANPILRRGGSPMPVRRSDSPATANPLATWEPWNDLAQMDRLFDGFFRAPLATAFSRGTGRGVEPSEPTVELYENGEELIAFVYAPGLAADSFDISATMDTLSIKGERKPLLETTEGLTSHTPWGGLATGTSTFSASYTLPVEIDPGRVSAAYKDGVLHIHLPKSEAAKPKQVKVPLSQG